MTEKIIVIHPEIKSRQSGDSEDRVYARDPDAALEEAVGLARAIDLDVVHQEIINLAKLTSATLLGSGSVKRIKDVVKDLECSMVFVDSALSPVQQRNLEVAWQCKVMDRTGLILAIFGQRARTKEGQLQVDLASLSYQRSRLVRAWSHLERQRGGTGKTGGPGETQIELDRRIIDEEIRKLKIELETVKKNRRLQRESRKKEPYPIIAIVGYTNAGKSTLFNRLTGAEVFAKDLLFATLDTTMRGLEMPSGQKAILSDTVGFISDLPTHLVAAFRATLEEVQEAAVILHVRDISQVNTEAEREDVLSILRDLGIDHEHDERIIEVMNKIDSLPKTEQSALVKRTERSEKAVAVSAIGGQGLDRLMALIDEKLCKNREIVYIDLPLTDGKPLSWLYDRAEVLDRRDDEERAYLKVSIEPADRARFEDKFDYVFSDTKPTAKKKKKAKQA